MKMNRNSLQPFAIFVICILLLGTILTVTYSVKMWKFCHPVDVAEYDWRTAKTSDYVVCHVKDYVYFSLGGDGNRMSYSAEYMTSLHTYYEFTIPTSNGKYVRLMVCDRDDIKGLVDNVYTMDDIIDVTGRIRKDREVNRVWYKNAGFDANLVEDKYAIFQESKKELFNGLMLGIFMMVAAFGIIISRIEISKHRI